MRNLVVLFLAAALAIFFANTALAQTEEAAAEFNLRDTNNNLVTLSDYKGKAGVLIFFWTTWCPFCREQLELINDKYTALSAKGLVVWGISCGEPAARVARFLKNYSLKYKILLDEYAEVALKYRVVGVPTYVLVDKESRIVYQDSYFPTDEEISRALD